MCLGGGGGGEQGSAASSYFNLENELVVEQSFYRGK